MQTNSQLNHPLEGTFISNKQENIRPILIMDLAKNYGGVEVRVLSLAKALHGRYPYKVAVLAGSSLHKRLETSRLGSLPVPFSRGDPRLLIFLWRIIRSEGFGVVDAHNVQSQFWGQLAALFVGGLTKVSTVHSAYRLEYNDSIKGKLYEYVLRLNYKWGGHFIAVSEAVNSYLLKMGIPANRISMIHNSIWQTPGSVDEPPADFSLMRSLKWPKNAYILIVVARLEPVKGHKFLIESLRQFVETHPRIRCLIVGDGRCRAELESQVEMTQLKEVVHFTGFCDDISALLKVSDLFCLPSLSEGLPYAVLEAAAHRLPLLVTRVGGMAELLTHKKTAFLVPPSDSSALKEGIEWFIEHPAEKAAMGQAAYEWYQQTFSMEKMISQTLSVYQEI
jgi:glycosyltransferase involved in cell wall biosynthesis